MGSNTPFTPPPGFVADDTKFLATGSWRGGSLVRFNEGVWQVRGGWERIMLEQLGGVCRGIFGWTDKTPTVNLAFGTHQTLEIWQSGAHVDITPILAGPLIPMVFPANQVVATTAGSPLVWCVVFNHNCIVGQQIKFTNLPFPIGGNVNLNGTWTVAQVVDVNNLKVTYSANATTSETAGGTTGIAQPAPFIGFTVGQIDGTGGQGYGTGAYGVGNYGQPSTADYYPLTWSFGAFGSWLVANPRGRGVYVWKNVLASKAIILAGAPAQVTYMLCLPQRQCMCFGCNEEVSGVFNPTAIRWSDIETIEGTPAWTTTSSNNAGEYILEGGGRIVTARRIGDYVFVWTDSALYLGTFVGAPDQTWKFELVAENCGAIGPNAPIISGQRAAWISPDRQVWQCPLGGVPSVMDCPIRSEFADHGSTGQDDKIVGLTISTYRELTWLYPDERDGLENSREFTVGANGWFYGRLARTVGMDAGPTVYPVMTDAAGNVFWHEKGHSADGGPLAGFVESNDFYLGEADGGLLINGCWPDLKDQIGTFKLILYTRENPQAIERTHGPWALSPGQSRRSFRVSGRLARIRFEFDSAPAYARGGKFEFDSVAIGGR